MLHSDLSQEHANTPLAPSEKRKRPPALTPFPQRKQKGGMGVARSRHACVSHHIVRSIFQMRAEVKSTEIRAMPIRVQMITGVSTGISR